MNKYTAEQVEAEIANYAEEAFPREEIDLERVTEMLRDYAALLRERESAKAGVTDEIRAHASFVYRKTTDGDCNELGMLNALEAVAPMLASARVPDGFVLAPRWKLERASEVLERNGDEHGVGADIREMIAAAPKPETDNT